MKVNDFSCILVDDETLAQDLLAAHLEQFPELSVVARFNNPMEALKYVESNPVDVVFLDIEMPGLNGMDFIRQLKTDPKIILTTAYAEFGLEGFDLQVVDYLLKPNTFERFKIAVQKVLHLLRLEQESDSQETTTEVKHLVIKSSHELIRIAISDILYVEGMHKYVKIVTAHDKHTTLYGLSALESELPSQDFSRCHRSFLVNINQVEKVSGNEVIVGQQSVPISKGNKSGLLEKMGKQI
ncbi:MAG: DNA-binding response regulator [Fluviicola sp. XM-24bin1]|nr:MAG: DNA-binding response regulator [Fluviicola sp. XM-24bin1]